MIEKETVRLEDSLTAMVRVAREKTSRLCHPNVETIGREAVREVDEVEALLGRKYL